MKEFYFTIGQKYLRAPHPAGLHPNGYLTIVAPSEEAARSKMFELCDNQWAFCYNDKKRVSNEYFPLGELRRIQIRPTSINRLTDAILADEFISLDECLLLELRPDFFEDKCIMCNTPINNHYARKK